tara:strand:+ start:23238 stop:24971 length:1734 start_codon:yes stop_codon:yes gene_type:complete
MNLSFKAKLVALTGFMASITVVVALIGYNGLYSVEQENRKVSGTALPNLNSLNDMFLNYRAVRINLRSLGLAGVSKEHAEDFISNVNSAIEAFEIAEKEYLSQPFMPGEEVLYNKLSDSWKHFKGIGTAVIGYYRDGSPEAKEKLTGIFLKDCPEAAKDFTAHVNELKAFHVEKAKTFVRSAEQSSSLAENLMILCSAIGLALSITGGYFFANQVTKSLTSVAHQLSSNANQVASASTQIASSSQQLSEASSEQAASLEQTAASLEEITSMISKATENAQNTSETSAESHKKAEEGRGAVDQMLTSMDEISQSNDAILTQINESNRQMTEIVKVIQDIGNKTKVINEIVFQTKLLSFNASVEAARAGEHGKGFAVVAEEVGNLAQMSGNAAKEITDMLDNSISKVEGIVKDTQQKVETLVQSGKEKVESGVTVAKQCSEVLNEIVQNVSRVSGLSQEISQATKEQAQGVSEINNAMTQLDTVTQQNAATSEEAASAAEELSAQAESLKASVAELMGIISGNRTESTESPVAALPKQVVAKKQKSNLVHLRSNKQKELKMVSGESSTPNRNDDGFKDV